MSWRLNNFFCNFFEPRISRRIFCLHFRIFGTGIYFKRIFVAFAIFFQFFVNFGLRELSFHWVSLMMKLEFKPMKPSAFRSGHRNRHQMTRPWKRIDCEANDPIHISPNLYNGAVVSACTVGLWFKHKYNDDTKSQSHSVINENCYNVYLVKHYEMICPSLVPRRQTVSKSKIKKWNFFGSCFFELS